MEFTAFTGPSYESASLPHDAQRSVNCFVEVNPIGTGKGKEVGILLGTPGLTRFSTANAGDGVCRPGGAINAANGRCFFVVGNILYELNAAGARTNRGTLTRPVAGRISWAESPDELIIVDGTAGYSFLYGDE
jgi:hypothetical protein